MTDKKTLSEQTQAKKQSIESTVSDMIRYHERYIAQHERRIKQLKVFLEVAQWNAIGEERESLLCDLIRGAGL